LEGAEKLAHEIDHDFCVDQIDHLIHVHVLCRLCFHQIVVQGQDEVYDEVLDGDLGLLDLRVNFRAQLYQEGDETGEVKFVELSVSYCTDFGSGAAPFPHTG